MDALRAREVIEFEQVFQVDEQAPPSRTAIVVTFLAILELVRLSALRVYQGLGESGAPEGPIHLRPASGSQDGEWEQQISEIT
jgi:chromatin segregation and condensation protein Rec8/ScpA/Scc1 (kleisin family)